MKKKYFLYAIAGMWAFCALGLFWGYTPDVWWFLIPTTVLLLGGWIWYKLKGLD